MRRTGQVSVVYIALAGLQRGTPLMILPFIAQVMSPMEFGAASMLTATSILLSTALAGPLEALVFRAAARSDDDSPAILRVAGLFCYAAMPAFLGLVAGGFALWVGDLLDVSGKIWAIALLAVGFQPAMTYFALPLIQARQRLGLYSLLAVVSSLTMAGTKVLFLITYELGVLGWVLSDLISAATSAVLAMALVRLPTARVDIEHIRIVTRFALPLIPHRSSAWVMSYASRPTLAVVSTMSQVGLLSLGLNLASIVTLIISEVNRAVMPYYSRESFPAPTATTSGVARFQFILAFTCPAVIGSMVALTGKWLFPESYWPAFSLLGILLIGQAAVGIYLVPANYLIQTAGITKPVALASIVGATVQIGLLVILGRALGAVGAAVATLTGFVVMAIIALLLPRFFNLEIAWQTWRRTWPHAGLGIIALLASVGALISPVGSPYAHIPAASSLLLSAVALVSVAASTRRL